jgi:hypothetical protein
MQGVPRSAFLHQPNEQTSSNGGNNLPVEKGKRRKRLMEPLGCDLLNSQSEPERLNVPEEVMYTGGALPTFIIIGVMKSGTTSLHHYLGQHPHVQTTQPKELNYFLSDDGDPINKEVRGRIFASRFEWYKEHFDPSVQARGESSPAYMDPGHEGVAQRMVEVVPDAALIVLTRDPFDRAVSHFHHETSRGRETRSLEEVLSDPTSRYVRMSRYHECLQPFFERFAPGQLIRYHQDDLDLRRGEVVANIFGRLGVDPMIEIENLEYRFNTAQGRQSFLHKALKFGRGSKLRSSIAKFLPKSLRYQIDVRSKAVKANMPGGASTVRTEKPPMLREQFEALVADDVAKFAQDFVDGRIIEGLPRA